MRTDLALDALDMGLWQRQRTGQDVTGLAQRSRSSISSNPLHRAARRADAVASVGSKGDSYDNALAEAFNSLFKAEWIRNPVMRPKGGWASIRDVEITVAEYVDWFNHRRLHGEIGMIPPVEAEAAYWASQATVEYAREDVPVGVGTN